MGDRRRECRTRLPDDRRIEVVEEKRDGAVVGGERCEDIALPREREERDAVAWCFGTKPPHFLFHPFETARAFVLREHRQRRVHREHDVNPLGVNDRRARSPAWSRERQRRKPDGHRHPRRVRDRRAPDAGRREPLNRGLSAEAREARHALPVPDPECEYRQECQASRHRGHPRKIEAQVHGSGPLKASSPSSIPSAMSAAPSGHRYSSR